MLTLTDSAVQVIRTVTTQPELPEQTGLRIAAPAEADGEGSLTLAVTEGPEAGDQVVEDQGARVYLQQDAASMLDQMTLDASVDDAGDVVFRLNEQPT